MGNYTTITRPGVSVTLSVGNDGVSGATWADALSAAFDAVRAEYSYLSMEDILDHVNETWGFLREKETTDEETAE